MTERRDRLDVAIVLVNERYASTAVGPIEIFALAGAMWKEMLGAEPKLRFGVRTASIDRELVESADGLRITPDQAIADLGLAERARRWRDVDPAGRCLGRLRRYGVLPARLQAVQRHDASRLPPAFPPAGDLTAWRAPIGEFQSRPGGHGSRAAVPRQFGIRHDSRRCRGAASRALAGQAAGARSESGRSRLCTSPRWPPRRRGRRGSCRFRSRGQRRPRTALAACRGLPNRGAKPQVAVQSRTGRAGRRTRRRCRPEPS